MRPPPLRKTRKTQRNSPVGHAERRRVLPAGPLAALRTRQSSHAKLDQDPGQNTRSSAVAVQGSRFPWTQRRSWGKPSSPVAGTAGPLGRMGRGPGGPGFDAVVPGFEKPDQRLPSGSSQKGIHKRAAPPLAVLRWTAAFRAERSRRSRSSWGSLLSAPAGICRAALQELPAGLGSGILPVWEQPWIVCQRVVREQSVWQRAMAQRRRRAALGGRVSRRRSPTFLV
jgi:hypothetical protein